MLAKNLKNHLTETVESSLNKAIFTYKSIPEILYIPDFLTTAECEHIKALCTFNQREAHFAEELTVDTKSFMCYTWRHSFYQDKILKVCCDRLAFAMGYDLDFAEKLEVRKFEGTGFYNKMCDYIAEDNHMAQFGSCEEFPDLAYENLDESSRQLAPCGNRVGTVTFFLNSHNSSNLIFKNLNTPHFKPTAGTAMFYNIDEDNIVYDVATNMDIEPMWMGRLLFREYPRRREEF